MLSPSLVLTRSAHRCRAAAVAPLGPVAGILTAPNVVILGASLEKYGFATSAMADGAVHADILAYAAAMGFTGTLRCHAIAGSLLASSISQHTAVSALAGVAATQGQNLYLCGGGGNNVSNARPYPGGAATMTADYDTLAANVAAKGDRLIPLELTKRLYTGAPAVVHGDAVTEQYGSLPYNQNVINPKIAAIAPDWLQPGGVPWVDTYGLAGRWPQLLTDGVHGYGHQFGHYVLSRLAARARGKRQADSRSGQSILWRPVDSTRAIGAVNYLSCWPTATEGAAYFHTGAICTDGNVEHFLNVISQKFASRGAGPGTGAYARLADTRFHALTLGSNTAYYVQSGGTVASVTLTFQNLNPGEKLRLSVAGCANSNSVTRRTLATLTAGATSEALSIFNHTAAASNQGVFGVVTVPASGEITLTIAPDTANGGTYGYLSGLILDWL